MQLNGSRKVIGVLRGYDVGASYSFHLPCIRTLTIDEVFLNIVLDEAVEERDGGEKVRIGMVVGAHPRQWHYMRLIEVKVIRGNSVVMLEVISANTSLPLWNFAKIMFFRHWSALGVTREIIDRKQAALAEGEWRMGQDV